jgi:SPP1 gp7 family putative phage head morphogenesis protein
MAIIERIKSAYSALVGEQQEVISAEASAFNSPYYAASQLKPYNPDDLVRKKGIEVYREMMRDDQVKAVMLMKMTAIYGTGFKIVPAGEEAADVELAKFIEYVIGDGMSLRRGDKSVNSFKKTIKRLYSSMIYGFSFHEKVYRRFESGEYAGKIGLSCIKTRPPHSFEFYTDDYNNLTEVKQHTNTGIKTFSGTDLDKFVIYSYDADNTSFGGWYGVSDLRAAYRPYWSKEMIIRFLNILIERFGMGIVVGKYPTGLSDSDKAILKDMIKNISAKTAFAVNEKVIFEILESKNAGTPPHVAVIQEYNKAIARSLLLPDKMGYTDSEGGSYNLGKNQFDLFMGILEDLREDGAEIINEQIINDIVDKNFSNVQKYPKFQWNPLTQKDKQKLSALFITAVEKGVVIATEEDEAHLREDLEFPKRTAESIPMPARPNPAQQEADGGEEKEADDKEDADDKKQPKKGEKFAASGKRAFTEYEKKVNFEAIEKETDGIEYEYGLEMGRVVSRIKDAVYNTVITKKIVDNQDYDAVQKLTLKYIGDMRMMFKDCLRKSFTTGRSTAKDEIKKTFAAPVKSLPPKEALAFFERKSFTLAGMEEQRILNKVQNILYDSIKTGKTTDDAIYNLEEFFDEYEVEQMTSAGKLKPIAEIPGRIEVVIRTNVNDAYNQGRIKMFEDPNVKDMIKAYQYSAIMDGRTSDICSALDEKVYKTSNPIWKSITPPNHHQCRSILVPVFADEWDGVESPAFNTDKLISGFGK